MQILHDMSRLNKATISVLNSCNVILATVRFDAWGKKNTEHPGFCLREDVNCGTTFFTDQSLNEACTNCASVCLHVCFCVCVCGASIHQLHSHFESITKTT